jgi:hypothetical protein
MRKNLVAMSAAAFVAGLGMAGSATAAVWPDNGAGTTSATSATREDVRQSGTGHQLIVPYFTTNIGNATLINIVNTDTVNGKAVKVRFRGASNSDDIFDFQVYLSPNDVWSANISQGANGISYLTTPDKSCTIPAAIGKDSGGAFSTFVLGRLPSAVLSGDALNAETREGYVEMFNMADIPPHAIDTTGADLGSANPNALFTAIKHISGLPPCNGGGTSDQQTAAAAAINALQGDPASLAEAYGLGFRSPSTGLFANWTIVNVKKSGSSSGEAVAITAVVPNAPPGINSTPGRGNIVFSPQVNGNPANVDFLTADPAFRKFGVGDGSGTNAILAPYAGTVPILKAQYFDIPDLSTPYLLPYPGTSAADPVNGVNLLQAVLATSSVSNEYLTDTTINAFTDWSLSQPTRRYAVVADYRPLAAGDPIGMAYSANWYYNAGNTSVNTAAGKTHQICAVTGGVTTFNREEGKLVGTNFVVSPNPPAPTFRLCGETSVLTFNSPTGSSVLGASVAQTNFTAVARDGWARLVLPGSNSLGLPLVGKAFVSATTSAFNIGASWEHRYTNTAP